MVQKHDDWNAFCVVCRKIITIRGMGKSAVKQHATSKIHIKNILAANTSVSADANEAANPVSNFDEDNSIDDLIAKAEIMWCLLCAEHDLSFLANDHITKMFPRMFPDSAIAAGYKCSRTKTRYALTHGTLPVYQSKLTQQLKKNIFSLLIDESNKLYGKKFLNMLVKFYDPELKKTVIKFLDLKVTNKADASSIINAIKETFMEKDLPYANLLHIMSDSPAVMRGAYKGVVTKLKQDHALHLLDIGGCSLHYINNAVKNATGKLYKSESLEGFLQDVSSFFSFHVEFTEEFSDLQEELHIDQHRLIKYTVVRFLSMFSSVKRFLEQFEAVKTLFLVKIPKYHPNVLKQERVARISKMLTDKITLPSLEFLRFSLQVFYNYEQIFQRKDPTIHLLYNKQVDLYKTTLLSFCKFEKVSELTSAYELVKFDFRNIKNHLDKCQINIGSNASSHIKSLSDNEKSLFRQGVKDFFIKLAEYLNKDLGLQNRILADLRFLNPLNKTVDYENAIVRLAKKMPPGLTLTTPEIDNISMEWKHLVLEDTTKFANTQSLDNYWNQIFLMQDDFGVQRFPVLLKVVRACLAFAEANAAVERAFSQIAHIIRKDRTRLLPETISALMVAKSHLETTGACYEQRISEDILQGVRQAHYIYENSSKAELDCNNNVAGPSSRSSTSSENKIKEEIEYHENKIKLQQQEAKKLIEEAQKLMSSTDKLTKELDKLKKRTSSAKTPSNKRPKH